MKKQRITSFLAEDKTKVQKPAFDAIIANLADYKAAIRELIRLNYKPQIVKLSGLGFVA